MMKFRLQVLAAICFVLMPGLDENSVALTPFVPYLVYGNKKTKKKHNFDVVLGGFGCCIGSYLTHFSALCHTTRAVQHIPYCVSMLIGGQLIN